MPVGTKGSVGRLLRAALWGAAFCGVVPAGATQAGAAQAGSSDVAVLGPCPLFPGPGDPVYCSLTMAASEPAPTTLQLPPAAMIQTGMPDIAWRDVDPYAIVFPVGGLPQLPPLSSLSGIEPAGGTGLGFTVTRSADAANQLSASYDVPVRGTLQLQSHSALNEAPDPSNSVDVQNYDASSGLSVTYAALPGVTVAVEPDVAVNWGDAAASQTRVGIGNRLSTDIARNLSVTLSAGYDSFFFAEDPLQNYRALQQRIAMTWGKQGNWQFGLSASSSSEWSLYEERRIISPGLFVTMPLAADVSLTARNDFGITRSSPYDDEADGRQDYRNSFGLQAVWKPALLANHAVRLMADYSLSYDTSLAAQSGLGNSVDLYETLARLAVAMRF